LTTEKVGYTGQRLDSETGLMPLGAGERYYSPLLGRFTQQDSLAGRLAQAQTLNRYAYVRNNPLRYADPTGHWGLGDILSAAGHVLKGAYNTVMEPFREAADVVTVIGAKAMGIDSEDVQLSSGLGNMQKQMINSGSSRSETVGTGLLEVGFGVGTVGVGLLARTQIQLAGEYNSGRMTLEEYNNASYENLGSGLAILGMSRLAGRGGAAEPLQTVGEVGTPRAGLAPLLSEAGRMEELPGQAGEVGARAAESAGEPMQFTIRGLREAAAEPQRSATSAEMFRALREEGVAGDNSGVGR
jgi:RHS repeat-associated protein